MDVLTPVVVGALLALFTGIQTWINKGRFDALQRRLDTFEQTVERRFERLEAEVTRLRLDILQVALAANPRPQTG